ncbi:MAG: hypothetical protein R3319_01910 [Candidatus Bathyarchaeia archaeon]|nr:hypothetical protein [Candidatus Bathyarchaeia archaeon]
MAKKYAMLFLVVLLVVVVVSFSVSDTDSSLVFAHNQKDCMADKAAGDYFTVQITFQNIGKTEGTLSINIAFEDKVWSQVGTQQNVKLGPGQTKTLTWNGTVPANAAVGSMARLVVYYNDEFKALNWWIHVVLGAELTIKSNSVE